MPGEHLPEGSWFTDENGVQAPTPATIRERAEAIRTEWSDREERRRRVHRTRPVELEPMRKRFFRGSNGLDSDEPPDDPY